MNEGTETDPTRLGTSLGKTFLSGTQDWTTVRITRLTSTPGTYTAYVDGHDMVTGAPLRAEIPAYIQ
ncbi:hypothetical protein [Cystobacter ferrugineus]|uniref:Uncharacterized protein n=1 Tax=Cystobacter ferrugineus TaxID=83449 RepID=A0A1L9AVN6_9BACT|nr:hypothetical protein [Cystobacter ferrugineus]OJH33983.1 hypothetical protein BON30_45850 [Cystobacter ferrugineus]